MDRILRGTVTRVDSQGVYVEVPKLGLGVEFGPAEVYGLPMLGSTEPAAGHHHAVVAGQATLRPRDKVLVATVNGVKEDLVVLGRQA